jgi:outer membrane protein OmpA-like peptidoglycan-associated protein
VGVAAANLALSDARAAAVKAALVSGFGIAASRITTKGFGDTKPAAPTRLPKGARRIAGSS